MSSDSVSSNAHESQTRGAESSGAPSFRLPRGVRAAGVASGLKPNGAPDLALLVSDRACACAGCFTTNRVKAAPVLYDQDLLARRQDGYRAIIANSGCANACTGQAGLNDAVASAQAVARAVGCEQRQVLLLSTGVIGQPLKMDKLLPGIAHAAAQLSPEGGLAAARAIMTTDTRPKVSFAQTGHYAIAGMCKGAGMIHPNMATMLAVITTDARISPAHLDRALRAAVARSFNRISVDGDMSTNDTVLVLANGMSGSEITDGASFDGFSEALARVSTDLAQQIVRDGEGATKFVEIVVAGARTEQEAVQVGRAIVNSPLVKTALYGGDANWGRVVAAAGYSGVSVEPDHMALWFGDVRVFANGMPTAFDEAASTRAISGPEVTIRLDLGMGEASTTLWTCDLSHDYVTINGKYRT